MVGTANGPGAYLRAMKRRNTLLATALLLGTAAMGQVVDTAQVYRTIDVKDPDAVYELPMLQEMPEFPGGMEALYRYLGENIHYPDLAVQEGAEGKVFVQFVIGKDGTIQDVQVIRGVRPDLDAEAMRGVQEMPAWSPGRLDGERVKVRFTLPVSFKL